MSDLSKSIFNEISVKREADTKVFSKLYHKTEVLIDFVNRSN